MFEKTYRLYPYRWAVLAVFMFINLTIQMLWITYSPITGIAAQYYGVTDLQIGFLAMVFMVAFIPLSIPVSWAIDTWGFRLTVSIGAVMMGIFGILRGLTGNRSARVSFPHPAGTSRYHIPPRLLDTCRGAVPAPGCWPTRKGWGTQPHTSLIGIIAWMWQRSETVTRAWRRRRWGRQRGCNRAAPKRTNRY